MKFLRIILFFSVLTISFIAIDSIQGAGAYALGCNLKHSSGSIWKFGIEEDGNQEKNTSSPNRQCYINPAEHFSLAANERVTAIRIASYEKPSECLPSGWEPTRTGFDYANYVAECANPNNNNPVKGSNNNSSKLIGYVDDGVKMEFPDGKVLCHAFPDYENPCTTPSYISNPPADYHPRSAGFIKDRFMAVGTSIGAPKNADGYVQPFFMWFYGRQNYKPGFSAWIAIDVQIETIDEDDECDPAVDPGCPPPPPPPPASCPTFNPTVRTFTMPNSVIPPSSNASRHKYSHTEVNSVTDQYGQSADWIDNGDGTVEVNYAPFINDYPYDSHDVTIYYTVYYTTDHYENEPITHTHNNPDYNGNGIADDGTYTETHDNWVYKSTSGPHATDEQTKNADPLPECYNRKFEIDASIGNSRWESNNEEVEYGLFAALVNTEYKVNTPGVKSLRNPNTLVDVPITVTVTVYDNNDNIKGQLTNDANELGCDNEFSNGVFTSPPSSSFTTVTNNSIECRRAIVPTHVSAGDYACVSLEFAFTTGEMDQAGSIAGSTTSNTRTINPSPAQPGVLGCTPRVVDRPYMTISGADVVAGSAFEQIDNSCPAPVASQISAWNRGSATASAHYPNTRYGGAGTSLAAYAAATVGGFTTATVRSSVPTAPNGLTYANTSGIFGSPPSATYGGNWSINNYQCIPNYYAEETGNPVTDGAITGLPSGSYTTAGGDLTIAESLNIPNGTRLAIFAGDVSIMGDITVNRVGYATVDDIPAVRIIASNIFIHPSVSSIDATLIAQPDAGGNGIIATCSSGAGDAPASRASIANGACRNNGLTVRGGLVADKVYFLRSRSSVRRSNVGTDYSFTGTDPDVAEHIIYTPMMWLTNFDTAIQEDAPYDAFTNMPPVL